MADILDREVRPRSGFGDRVPPHNLEAEQATLGAMFLSAEAVEGTLALLQPEDFVRPAHARIFSAMSDLYNRSVPIDHLSVADRLESTGEIENAGGKAYLLDVTGVVPTAANWVRYAEIVKRTSMLRQLIGAGTQIVALGYDAPDDLDQVVGDAEKLVFDVRCVLPNPHYDLRLRPLTGLDEAVICVSGAAPSGRWFWSSAASRPGATMILPSRPMM